MKWAVYWDNPRSKVGPDVVWLKTKEDALVKLAEVVKACEADADEEEGVPYWDITLLQVMGDVVWSPNGLETLLY